jgi:hypothetical protein
VYWTVASAHVARRIRLQHDEVRAQPGSDAASVFVAEPLRRCCRERGEDVPETQAGLGHERVLLAWVVADGARVGAEEDGSARRLPRA